MIGMLGATLAGVVTVPVNPSFRSTEFGAIMRRSGATAVLRSDEHRGIDFGRMIGELDLSLALELRTEDLSASMREPSRGRCR